MDSIFWKFLCHHQATLVSILKKILRKHSNLRTNVKENPTIVCLHKWPFCWPSWKSPYVPFQLKLYLGSSFSRNEVFGCFYMHTCLCVCVCVCQIILFLVLCKLHISKPWPSNRLNTWALFIICPTVSKDKSSSFFIALLARRKSFKES